MENEIVEKSNLIKKIIIISKKKKKQLFLILFCLICIFFVVTFYVFYQSKIDKKISEKYIQAGIHVLNKDIEKSKTIYKEIILSKHKFYSILAMNNIIENGLEKNDNEIIKLFKSLEKMNISKDQKNLIKLKKALYLKKMFKDNEGNKLLEEIIADDSIWKNTAIEITK